MIRIDQRRPDLQDEGGEVRGRRRRHRGAQRAGQPVLVGTIVGRDVRAPLAAARAPGRARTRCSTPSSTSARRRSSRARASRARSRSRPTWPAAASTSSSARACTKLGGLYVLGTERHESRRIDNQLRGRSGRQGDPGETRFYLSAAGRGDAPVRRRPHLHDPRQARARGGRADRAQACSRKRIEGAQKKVEELHFEIRKNVLKYDDVLNKQRKEVYDAPSRDPRGRRPARERVEWIEDVIEAGVDSHTEGEYAEEWEWEGMWVGPCIRSTRSASRSPRSTARRSTATSCSTAYSTTRCAYYEEREQRWGEELRPEHRALDHPAGDRRALA